MTWEDVVRFFGQEDKDPSETLFRLSVELPAFSWRDLLSVFDAVADARWEKRDVNPEMHPRTGMVNAIAAMRAHNDDRTYFLSDIAFRNLYRVMFETSEWDDEILFAPDFFGEFSKRVELLRESSGRSTGMPPDRRKSLDLYEAFAEFRDRLAEKIRLRSGA